MADTTFHARSVMIIPRLMKVRTAAHYLGISETKFRLLVQKGLIPRPKRQGGNVTWDIHDLNDFADELPRDGEVKKSDWDGVIL